MEMRTPRLLALVLPALLASGPGLAAGPKPPPPTSMKCWTNKEGVRECGNVVPPEYSQQETRTIDERGVVEVKERAKTPEELAAEEQQRKQAEAAKAEAERVKAEAERRDQVLLSVYTSTDDIVKSRDQKLAALQSSVDIAAGSSESLKRRMADEQKRAAGFERQGKPVPEDVKKSLADLDRQIKDKQAYIASLQKEKTETQQKYDADLQRFKELKAPR